MTFGLQPASLQVPKTTAAKASRTPILQPDSRPYFYYAASPGAVITDHVAVLNYSAQPLSVQTYAADALNDSKGGFSLQPGSKKPVDAGAWTTLSSDQVTVPARRINTTTDRQTVGVQYLTVHITVPDYATPGDHVGGIVVALQSTGTRKGTKVTLEQRVGARVFIRVAGPLVPALTVENLHVSYRNNLNPVGHGSLTIAYRLHNTGNVKLGGLQQLTVRGWLGRTGRIPALAAIPLLLPGSTLEQTVTVPSVAPEFRVTASVSVAPLKLQGDVDPTLHSSKASSAVWAVPWTLLFLVIVLLLLLTAAIVFVVRRRRRTGAAAAAADADDRAPDAADSDDVTAVNYRPRHA